jgi:transposase-like protein
MTQQPDIKRWTARRKAELIKQIYRGQTTIPEAARRYDLTQQEIEKWMDDAEAGMENALKANPKDVAEQYESQLRKLREAYGEAMLELKFRKKVAAPSRLDRRVIDRVITEMASEGDTVTAVQACRWAGISRRSYDYRPRRKTPRIATGRPGQTGYRGPALCRVSHGCLAAGRKQEHHTAAVSAQRVAGAQAAKRSPAAGGSSSFGGIASERALGNGHCPGLVWTGTPLVCPDHRHGLSYP